MKYIVLKERKMSKFVDILREKGIADYDAYAFLDTDERLQDNIHLLVFGGSRAYGTNTPTSDTDIRGIATNSKADILTYNDFETIVETETDTVIYSVDKIFKLLADCNPNTIEILFVRDEDIIYADEIGKKILDNRNLFLSEMCIPKFGGYANQQLYRLQQKTLSALTESEYKQHIAKVIQNMKLHLKESYGVDSISASFDDENGLVVTLEKDTIPMDKLCGVLNEVYNVYKEYTKNSKRNEKALAHNKITKHAMHLIRLYIMANELLTTGTVHTYRDAEHDLLMSIRNGDYSDGDMMSEKFFDLLRDYEAKFEDAKLNSVLPKRADIIAIERLRANINETIIIRG